MFNLSLDYFLHLWQAAMPYLAVIGLLAVVAGLYYAGRYVATHVVALLKRYPRALPAALLVFSAVSMGYWFWLCDTKLKDLYLPGFAGPTLLWFTVVVCGLWGMSFMIKPDAIFTPKFLSAGARALITLAFVGCCTGTALAHDLMHTDFFALSVFVRVLTVGGAIASGATLVVLLFDSNPRTWDSR